MPIRTVGSVLCLTTSVDMMNSISHIILSSGTEVITVDMEDHLAAALEANRECMASHISTAFLPNKRHTISILLPQQTWEDLRSNSLLLAEKPQAVEV